MKRVFFVFLIVFLFSNLGFAQHDHEKGKKGGHGPSSLGKSIFKGEVKGVKVEAWLNDIESAMKAMMKDSNIKIDMSKMDPNLTHHISFKIVGNEKIGKIKGATLKISLKEAREYSLMFMQGHYGSDISLKDKGTYSAELKVVTEKGEEAIFNFKIKN